MSYKNTIKKKLSSGCSINADELYSKVKPYQYVSFDIFDTLVKRNLENPIDVFKLMEHKVGSGFANQRIEAEKKARENLKKATEKR